MEHLMRLELKKVRFKNYILLSGLAVAAAMFFVFVSLHDSSAVTKTYEDTFRTVEMLLACEFIVFFAVLNGALVISEYNNRTILLMFTYPVGKKKVIAAKLLVNTGFIALSILAGYVAGGLFIVWFGSRSDRLEGEFSAAVLGGADGWIARALVTTIVFCCLGLWTFAAGMVKKSVTVTIVSAIFCVFLRQLVVASSAAPRESIGVMLAAVAITAALLWYTFEKKITELD